MRIKNPRHAMRDGGPQNEHPPPQEANVSSDYVIPLLSALEHADVVTEIVATTSASDCEWCQDIGAHCDIAVYWMPRADVLSDGYAECCLACAPERIRRAVDDSLLSARVQVEVPESVIA